MLYTVPTMPTHLLSLLAIATPVLVQFAFFVRWMHRRLRDDEIHRAFLVDVATHHLPHIYSVLRLLAQSNGLDVDEPPPVHFIELNGPARGD